MSAPLSPERLAPLLVPAGIGLVLWPLALPPALLVALASVLAGVGLLALPCVGRDGLFRLMGPVFPAGLSRAVRVRRLHLWRVLLGGVLLLAFVFLSPGFGQATPNRAAQFGESFVNTLVVIQWGFVLILVPGLVAGVVAEERAKARTDFLLTTDLRSREIVLGGAFARLAEVAGYVLLPVPLLVVMSSLGGVDPWAIVVSEAVLLLAGAGLAGVSLCVSVHAPTPASARSRAFGLAAAYVGISTLLPLTLPLLKPLGWGNPWTGAGSLWLPGAQGDPTAVVATTGPVALRRFALVHLSLFLVGTVLAVARLRSATEWLRTAGGRRGRARRAADFGDSPVYRRDLSRHRGVRKGRLAALGYLALASAAVGCQVAILWAAWAGVAAWETANYVRIVGTIAVLGNCLWVAFRASGDIDRERADGSWELLCLTRLRSREILRQKWRAAVVTGIEVPAWIVACWATAAVAGVIPWWVVPHLTLGLVAYRVSAAALGLWLAFRFDSPWNRAWGILWRGLVLTLAPVVLCCPTVGFSLGLSPPVFFAGLQGPESDLTPYFRSTMGSGVAAGFGIIAPIGFAVLLFAARDLVSSATQLMTERRNNFDGETADEIPLIAEVMRKRV